MSRKIIQEYGTIGNMICNKKYFGLFKEILDYLKKKVK